MAECGQREPPRFLLWSSTFNAEKIYSALQKRIVKSQSSFFPVTIVKFVLNATCLKRIALIHQSTLKKLYRAPLNFHLFKAANFQVDLQNTFQFFTKPTKCTLKLYVLHYSTTTALSSALFSQLEQVEAGKCCYLIAPVHSYNRSHSQSLARTMNKRCHILISNHRGKQEKLRSFQPA